MKTVKLMAAVLSLLCMGAVASAQVSGSGDASKKILKAPYVVDASANWWVSVAGGISAFGDGGFTPIVTPAVELTVGKWITPTLGLRLGYQGFKGAMWAQKVSDLSYGFDPIRKKYKTKFGNSYIHLDFLVDVVNWWGGYKPARIWNTAPYAHIGVNKTYNKEKDFNSTEFAGGFGLYNTVAATDRLDVTLDLRGILLSGRHHGYVGGVSGEISFTVGIAVDLGKNTWKRK